MIHFRCREGGKRERIARSQFRLASNLILRESRASRLVERPLSQLIQGEPRNTLATREFLESRAGRAASQTVRLIRRALRKSLQWEALGEDPGPGRTHFARASQVTIATTMIEREERLGSVRSLRSSNSTESTVRIAHDLRAMSSEAPSSGTYDLQRTQRDHRR